MGTRGVACGWVLVGVLLAGHAAADGGDDCIAGATLVTGGFHGVCLLEENAGTSTWRSCTWTTCSEGGRTWAEHRLASADVAQRAGAADAGAGAEAAQREEQGWRRSTDASGGSRSNWDRANTTAAAHHRAALPPGSVEGSAAVRQWDDAASSCDRRGCSEHATEGTSVAAHHGAGPLRAQALVAQSRTGGAGCAEVVQVGTTLGSLATPAQPCAAEAPQLTADPRTRFPDAPDGTGLPFL